MVAFALVLLVIGAILLILASPRKGGAVKIAQGGMKATFPEITGWAKIPAFILGLAFIGLGVWMGVSLFVQSLDTSTITANQSAVQSTETPSPPTLTSTAPPTETPVPPTLTSTPTATSTLTSTSMPTPTNTPLPGPLPGVFPLVGDGTDFLFPEGVKPDLIKRQFIKTIKTGECLRSPPYGVQLTYNFTGGGGGGWGIGWVHPPQMHLNLTGFTELTFWVKGTSGNETFQIGLKDTGQIEVKGDEKEIFVNSERYLFVSSSEWGQVIVPLIHFADATGPVNFASIDNMSIGFSSAHGSGSICIDDIAFK